MSDIVKVRVDAPSGTILLNRPECRNALSQAMVEGLVTALEDLFQERKVRAVILTGAGASFCSGTDLRELNQSYEQDNPFVLWHQQVSAIKNLIELMLRYPKPIIAAVHGATAGIGVGLALACDRIIAGESTYFVLPEARRGLNAGLTIPLLSMRTGKANTSNLLLFDQAVKSSEGLRQGLFDEVVPDDLLWVRSLEVAKLTAQGARESHQMTKRMLNETIGENLLTLLNIAAADMASARTTEVAREGVAAFLAKREPNWDRF